MMSFLLSSSLLRNVFLPTHRSRPRTNHRLCCLGTPISYGSSRTGNCTRFSLHPRKMFGPLLYISFLCRWRGKAMPEIRVIHRRSGGRGTREASRDHLDLEERRSKLRTLLVVCPRAPYRPLQGPIRPMLLRAQFFLFTHASKRKHRPFYKQASAQDLTVQFTSEFAQIPAPFPQRSSAVGYCIISCYPLGTTQWCR